MRWSVYFWFREIDRALPFFSFPHLHLRIPLSLSLVVLFIIQTDKQETPIHYISATLIMNQFFQRVANYVANEVIVKGLAESRTFQKFAVRTNKQYTDTMKQGSDKLNMTLEEAAAQQAGGMQAAAASGGGPPKPPLRGVPGFFVAFGKELRKDITGS
jgi:hypothetical protein